MEFLKTFQDATGSNVTSTAILAMMILFLFLGFLKPKSSSKSFVQQQFKNRRLCMKDELLLYMLQDKESYDDGKPCYVITDPSVKDNPIVYASTGFCAFTQYSKEEIENRNCRFLQGKDTSPDDVTTIRQAINEKNSVSVKLINYKKDGTKFLNQFFLCPLHDEKENVVYFLGVQKEVFPENEFPEASNLGWRIMKTL